MRSILLWLLPPLVYWGAAPLPATALDYGNNADLGGSSNHAPHVLLGERIYVAEPFTLTDVAIIFNSAGYNAQVGIYTENESGRPEELLVDTGSFPATTTGHVSTPTDILDGQTYNYYLMPEPRAGGLAAGVALLAGIAWQRARRDG